MLPDVKIHALVAAPRGLFVEDARGAISVDEFCIALTESSWLVMRRMAASPRHFEVAEVQLANSASRCPQASWRGVLWSRQAACAADRSVVAFESEATSTAESGSQLVPGDPAHEA